MSTKKSLFHSELVKMGIVTARINSEPTESKFPGKPKWLAVEINGEERYLNLENEECELALTGHKDEWVELQARGSRDDAVLLVEPTTKPESADVRKQIAEVKAKIMADENTDEKPRATQPEVKVVTHSEGDKLASYAAHSGRIFALAWEETKKAMALIPVKDAAELTAYEWLDLRLRIAQGYTIEINKIIRKERF